MLRVRFAPSPTGYLHIGSARTFIFNWLYARRNGGTMILRIDDTDVERNTQESLDSIYEGLQWLDLSWDEFYRQSERGELHRKAAESIFAKGLAYRDFRTFTFEDLDLSKVDVHAKFNPEMREMPKVESDLRAAAGEPFVLRFRVPRESRTDVTFQDMVYGPQSKATADIEDFALLRSSGVPTYHMASCADDADLRISHIIRGQDHLTNTFKHVLIFEALGVTPPNFAHLPLLIAPDGSKLSKRKHGPVVSVTTYRDAGFLPQAFVNFVCLLGWSPKDNREVLSRQELIDAFSLEGINHSNATVNFTEQDPFDPKAVWLNSQHIRAVPVEQLAEQLLPFAAEAGFAADRAKMLQVTPLIHERIQLLRDVKTWADIFFLDPLPPYDSAELIPQKGDAAMAATVLARARQVLGTAEFSHDALDAALRAAAAELKIKTGQMFQPIRVAVCGRKVAPPLFETLEVLGREITLKRIDQALQMLPAPLRTEN
ncbi:MAG: glutamate--tRNA ligase [Acidobacteriia bacterium]|nr:glutamate--tRNA ligase [Terriglobia bacterium]